MISDTPQAPARRESLKVFANYLDRLGIYGVDRALRTAHHRIRSLLMDGVDGPMEGLSFDPFENDNLGRQEVLAAAKKAAK